MRTGRRLHSCSVLLGACGLVRLATHAALATADLPPANSQSETLSAGPIVATLMVDRSSMTVAQDLVAELKVTAPSGVRVELPIAGTKLGEFTIASVVDEPPVASPQAQGLSTVLVRRYKLEPFLPGEYTIPPLRIGWHGAGKDDSGSAKTAPVKVSVVSLLAPPKPGAADGGKSLDPGTIRDAYTVPQPRETSALLLGIAVGVGVAGLVGAGVWAGRRRRAALDPLEIEFVRLTKRLGDPQTSPLDLCHGLSAALRNSLADRLDARALVAGPEDFESAIGARGIFSSSDIREAGIALRRLDALRFSGDPVTRESGSKIAETVLTLIQKLRSVPRAPTRTGGGP